MEILIQLGANKTAFLQFILFVITISFLTVVVFNPYMKAYDQRLKKTKGAEVVAKETVNEAKGLALIYQSKAREVSEKISTIFDRKKTEAGKTTADIINRSKAEAELITQSSRKEIEAEVKKAQSQVQQLSQEIALQLKQKLEGGL